MREKITRWAAPPIFEDDIEKTWHTSLLNMALLTLMAFSILLIIGNLIGGRTSITIFVLDGITFVGSLLLHHTLHAGKIRLTSILMVVSMFVFATLALIHLGTIRTPTTSVFLLIVIITGLLFGRDELVIATVLSSLIVLTLILAENAGILPPPDYRVNITQWITYSILFILSGALIYIAHQTTAQTIKLQTADIAKRKQTEEALLESEKRYRRLFNLLPYGAELIDLHGRIMECNPNTAHMLGYEPDELIGKHITTLFKKTSHIEFENKFAKIKKGDPQQADIKMVHKDGSVIDVIRIGRPIYENGRISSFLAVNIDITKRKKIEEELLQAKEAAETANRAKSSFVSNMSHELRTPLNGILGYTQIFKRDRSLTKTQQEGIDIIHRSGEHLLMMINDILDLSKIEADRIELAPVEIYLSQFMESIVHMMQLRAQEKGLEFRYEPSPSLPEAVFADATRLRQILFNLLGNAVKFTKHGYVALHVRTIIGEETAVQLQFEVKDSGVGISLEQQAKIFEPFRQTGNKQKKHQGTGLGLAISQRLTRIMGGDLYVESDENGSRFWFNIPLVLANVPSKKDEVEAGQATSYIHTTKTQQTAFKILIVDDFEHNRTVLKTLLLSLGFVVSEADSGINAIIQTDAFEPDLIFMDLIMPDVDGGIDGLEATSQLKRHPKYRHIPIIAHSASLGNETQQESNIAGCDDFLSKPFETTAVLDILKQYLPLQWIYKDDETTPSQNSIPSEDLAITLPPKVRLETLLNMVIIGDLHNLKKELRQLEEENTDYTAFTAHLNQFATDFNMSEIEKYLRNCLKA